MTKVQGKGQIIDLKGHIEGDRDFFVAAVKAALEAALEAEMTETLCAEKSERSEARIYAAQNWQARLSRTRDSGRRA